MRARDKARGQILTQYYVTISDLRALLGLNYREAREVFGKVDEIESKQRFRPHTGKVALKNCLEYMGVDFGFLKQQISMEGERENEHH